MNQSNTDPRVQRTRKLIMDSFIEISSKKEFKDITVKDITTEAFINRSTFYYHFDDIYDLLEKVLSEVLLVNLNYETYQNAELNEQTLTAIFKAITNFQKSLSNRCHSGYEDTIARIIREQLEIIFCKMLLKQNKIQNSDTLKMYAVMLSWGIYGISVEWRKNIKLSAEEYIKLVIPSILYGIEEQL